MEWNNYFLWAGLIFLYLVLYHFIQQRKGHDRNTLIFYQIIFEGIGICALGILIAAVENRELLFGGWLTMFLAACLDFIQALLPYALFRFVITRLKHSEERRRFYERMGLIPLIGGTVLILVNILLDLLPQISEEGVMQPRRFFSIYVGWMLLYYGFLLLYVWKHRQELGVRGQMALGESCAILIFGLCIQHYFQVRLFFGFSVALAVFVLYLVLKNPHAYIDIGTYVFNAEYFYIWIREKLNTEKKGVLIAVDLYQLDQISRLYPDETGRKLTAAIAEFLWSLDQEPRVFRIMPWRFLIWVDTLEHADRLLKRCGERLRQPFVVKNHVLYCSAVLVKFPLDKFGNIEELMSCISFCIKQADKQESVQIISGNRALWKQFEYEVEVERFLKEALEQDLYQVWFQPIYSLKEKKFIALEALSRLRHPTLGWISPELFIRIAAQDGLLSQIMVQQVKKICRFMKEHEEALSGIENVKINLSPQELADPEHCETLLNIIRENEIPPSRFQFEVTESVATQYSAELQNYVQRLRQTGIHLCLDDFGSGYANLNTVMRIPFSTIKLDKSLLQGICQNESAAFFYRGLVSLLIDLGYTVISEGVETEREVELLTQWGVELIQGYYFSTPLPPEEVTDKIQRDSSHPRAINEGALPT